jgi:hypothetical protein
LTEIWSYAQAWNHNHLKALLKFVVERQDQDALKILVDSFTTHTILCSLEFSIAVDIIKVLHDSWESSAVQAVKEKLLSSPYAVYFFAFACRSSNDSLKKDAEAKVTAQEYWRLARDPYFANIKNNAQTSSKIKEWNEPAVADESLREEEQLAEKLLAAVLKNEAAEARKIINGADIRRLPYSQGKMGNYL